MRYSTIISILASCLLFNSSANGASPDSKHVPLATPASTTSHSISRIETLSHASKTTSKAAKPSTPHDSSSRITSIAIVSTHSSVLSSSTTTSNSTFSTSTTFKRKTSRSATSNSKTPNSTTLKGTTSQTATSHSITFISSTFTTMTSSSTTSNSTTSSHRRTSKSRTSRSTTLKSTTLSTTITSRPTPSFTSTRVTTISARVSTTTLRAGETFTPTPGVPIEVAGAGSGAFIISGGQVVPVAAGSTVAVNGQGLIIGDSKSSTTESKTLAQPSKPATASPSASPSTSPSASPSASPLASLSSASRPSAPITSTTAPKPTASSPAPPAPPVYSSTSNFTLVFNEQTEKDASLKKCSSSNYLATIDSLTDSSAFSAANSNPQTWCLAKCTGTCHSVFVTRDRNNSPGKPYFICSQYSATWDPKNLICGVDQNDASAAWNIK